MNGRPGLMAVLGGQVINVLTFDVADGRIAACSAIRNPEELARVEIAWRRPAGARDSA